jgi:hypothetical protein
VVIAVAPDRAQFRKWIGPNAPEWGAAVAFPESHRIVMQGSSSGSRAGDPIEVLRHELAHLALHEALGDMPPRWFDEGYASYAANEIARDAVLGANLALLFRGMPALDSLDAGFAGGSLRAEGTYALAYRAVAELAARDPEPRPNAVLPVLERRTPLRSRHPSRLWDHAAAVRGDLAVAHAPQVRRARALRRPVRRRGRHGVPHPPFYVIRRRRDRLRMAALVRADQEAERRDAASAIEALLRSISLSMSQPGETPQSPPPDESSRPPHET